MAALPVKSPRAGQLQASPCMNVARAARHVCRPIRNNGTFDNDRLRESGGRRYDSGATADAIDLTGPG